MDADARERLESPGDRRGHRVAGVDAPGRRQAAVGGDRVRGGDVDGAVGPRGGVGVDGAVVGRDDGLGHKVGAADLRDSHERDRVLLDLLADRAHVERGRDLSFLGRKRAEMSEKAGKRAKNGEKRPEKHVFCTKTHLDAASRGLFRLQLDRVRHHGHAVEACFLPPVSFKGIGGGSKVFLR